MRSDDFYRSSARSESSYGVAWRQIRGSFSASASFESSQSSRGPCGGCRLVIPSGVSTFMAHDIEFCSESCRMSAIVGGASFKKSSSR